MTTTSPIANWPDGVVSGPNALLADNLALQVKTKKSHWHLSGPEFRDYHLLFDDQASQNPFRSRVGPPKLAATLARTAGSSGALKKW
jgi:starvation-inducible DNA-binding protein